MRVVIDIFQGYANAKGMNAKYLETVEVPGYLAEKLIAHGIAKPAPPAPVVETEAVAPSENAAQRTGKVTRKARAPIASERKGA